MLVYLAVIFDNWDFKFLDLIVEKYYVIVVDFFGVGVSQGKVVLMIFGMVKQIIDFVKVFGYDKINFFGFFMGGMIV